MDVRKRGRGESGMNANGGFKKSKPEMDSLSSGIGSKLKPCTKFFSKAGCPFGENCHFLHYYPGGYNAVAQVMNITPAPATRPAQGSLPVQNGSAPAGVKTKLCNKYGTAEGCKFNEKCHFAHGEWELGKPIVQSKDDPRSIAASTVGVGSLGAGAFSAASSINGGSLGAFPSRLGARSDPAAATFGVIATAKISVDASLVGAIIGKGGTNSKEICRQTGAKLGIRDHETDVNLRNIELEGTFEQIKLASGMVRELIMTISPVGSGPTPVKGMKAPHAPGSNFKTKICENFAKGSCTFGEKCHFAHGAGELRKTGIRNVDLSL